MLKWANAHFHNQVFPEFVYTKFFQKWAIAHYAEMGDRPEHDIFPGFLGWQQRRYEV